MSAQRDMTAFRGKGYFYDLNNANHKSSAHTITGLKLGTDKEGSQTSLIAPGK